MKSPLNLEASRTGHFSFAATVQLIIAVLFLCWSGFFTMDFLLSGIYTWPRSSRTMLLSMAVAIFSYEFVYKEQRARIQAASGMIPIKSVVYFCLLPYLLGSFALIALLNMS